jgi:hypothetical protein
MPQRTAVTFAVVACVVAAFWGAKLVLGAGIVDDTYIFLRYAENLANGNGLVFNLGERVEGYTSPLWVLLLGLFSRLGLDLALTSVLLAGLFGSLLILTFAYFGRTYIASDREPLLWIVALALAVNPSLVYWAWSGMDTALFAFFFGLGLFVFIGQLTRPGTMYLSGFCFLGAALTRLDVLAVLPVYAVAIVLCNRDDAERMWRKSFSFAAPLCLLSIHFLWRYWYYGSFLPNTFYAKVGVPRSELVRHGLIYAARFFFAFNLYGGALVAVALTKKRASEAGLVVPVAVVATWTAYVVFVGGDHFAMFRFFVPVLVPLAFLLLLVVERLSPATAEPGWRRAGTLVAIAAVLFFLNWWVYWFHGGARARYEVQLAKAWGNVGSWLKANVPSGSTIACVPVGAIPYFSGLETYDLLGLTDRTIARYGKTYLPGAVGHQKYDTDYILSRRPDYIVYTDSGLTEKPRSHRTESLDTTYSYSLYDLVRDTRTKERYDFLSIEMPDGRYIELLHLKAGAEN